MQQSPSETTKAIRGMEVVATRSAASVLAGVRGALSIAHG